jgi:hypothetical protein
MRLNTLLKKRSESAMNAIGIRVSPKKVFYAVVKSEKEEMEIVNSSNIVVPKALETPGQLAYVRKSFLDIIEEYSITRAGIRLAEPAARTRGTKNGDIFRYNLEGVVQELIDSSTVEKYFCGPIATLASLLDEKPNGVKQYLDGDMVFAEIEDWGEYKKEEKESILSAFAAIYL